jgi:light-regulated signal transduction histidine kinase (bacteriophytochrome)
MNKRKQSDELILAYQEIACQIEEKGKRAAELVIANLELSFQNEEKENRAAELVIANRELAFQNKEKEKRAAESILINYELAFQIQEREKRAEELATANIELTFQNNEKEKRAEELIIANLELIFQNKEKEKRAEELMIANKELEQFAFIASHDLLEPLRTVSNYIRVFEQDYVTSLDATAFKYLHSIKSAAERMSALINSLLLFSRLGYDKKLGNTDFKKVIDEVIDDLNIMIKNSDVTIEVSEMPRLNVYEVEIRQVFQNLITNAIKFRKKDTQLRIKIQAENIDDKWKFSVSDNGIGISPIYYTKIFDIFQRLHSSDEYEGSGIGLANCKKIIHQHQGQIGVDSNSEKGTTFYFTIPNLSIYE